jgi:hypothetical protein
MTGQRGVLSAVLAATVLLAGVIVGTSFAQKASVPKTQDRLALGEDDVKKLMLLIDTSKTSKISKQEWMKFMEDEFDRLDTNKSGELDAKELAQSRIKASPFGKVGK